MRKSSIKLNSEQIEKALSNINLNIQSGRFKLAQDLIKKLIKSELNRNQKNELSNLCRRVGWPQKGLELLKDIFNPNSFIQPNFQEQISYSANLIQMGLSFEAEIRLNKLIADQNQNINQNRNLTSVYLQLGLLKISQWNYSAAKKYFIKMIIQNDCTQYQMLIGKLNLAACYSFCQQYKLAEKYLKEIIKNSINNKYYFVLFHAFEIKIQIEYFRNNIKNASFYLNKLNSLKSKLNISENSFNLFVIKKWTCLLNIKNIELEMLANKSSELKLNNSVYKSIKELHLIRKNANKYNFYEIVRDCDLYLSFYSEDQNYQHVLYGTPYKAYSKKIKYLINEFNLKYQTNLNFKKENKYYKTNCPSIALDNLKNTVQKTEITNIFDVQTGYLNNAESIVSKSKPLLNIIKIITKDFYKGISFGEFYYLYFQESYYNPLSSPARIYKSLNRIQNILKKNEIPLDIKIEKGQIKLKTINNCQLIFSKTDNVKSNPLSNPVKWLQFRKEFKNRKFTVQQATNYLNVSDRHFRRLIKPHILKGTLKQFGNTRNKYFIWN